MAIAGINQDVVLVFLQFDENPYIRWFRAKIGVYTTIWLPSTQLIHLAADNHRIIS